MHGPPLLMSHDQRLVDVKLKASWQSIKVDWSVQTLVCNKNMFNAF